MAEVSASEGMLGKYRILGTLGRGSMGVVYKAEDPSIGRIVAIKTLRKIGPSKFQDAENALERFRTEARSAGRLRHPNIITIFDASINDDTPYIVMDYVEGSSLESLIHAEGRIEPKRALHLLSQLADALDEAHKHGVIHRDIKPSNLVVDSKDRLYVLDFGVAKLNETIQEEMADGAKEKEPVMGTPAYMSPEQILNKQLKAQSDLFSFALVCFEVLSGSRPFPGETFNEVVNSILHSSPIPITSLVPDFPLQLEVEFEHALAKNPEERPETAAEVMRVLTKALDLGAGVGTGRGGQAPMVGGGRTRKPSEWKSIGSIPPRDEIHPSGAESRRSSTAHQETPPRRSNNPDSKELISLQRLQSDVVERRPSQQEEYSAPGAAPGDAFSHDDGGLRQNVRFRREFSLTRTLALMFGVFAVSLSSYLLYTVLQGENPMELLGLQEGSEVMKEPVSHTGPSREDWFDNKIEQPEYKIPEKVDEQAAVGVLVELPEKQVLAILNSEKTDVKRKLEALEEVKNRRMVNLVKVAEKLLSHEFYIVRLETAKTLGDLGNREAAPILVEHLSDHDPLVRLEVVRAIGKLGSLRSVSYLKSFYASEENPKVKKEIKEAVEQITGLPMKQAR